MCGTARSCPRPPLPIQRCPQTSLNKRMADSLASESTLCDASSVSAPSATHRPDIAAIFIARYARGASRTPCFATDSNAPHVACGSWLAAWNLAEGLATAERYAMAMAVAAGMVASHLLPSPRQPSRSKRRGRGGTSGSRLAQPRVRKLWQCERARRSARGVLRSSTVRPRQFTPDHALASSRQLTPAHASPCPRQLTPAPALACSRQPPALVSSRLPCPRQRPPTTTGRTTWMNRACCRLTGGSDCLSTDAPSFSFGMSESALTYNLERGPQLQPRATAALRAGVAQGRRVPQRADQGKETDEQTDDDCHDGEAGGELTSRRALCAAGRVGLLECARGARGAGAPRRPGRW